ncbi:MAG: hypothetical protein NZM31_03605 [Gemmatales bacterium]|nr:hypothetical protein [Gemmatales bacterium]MDW8386085.1 hypothetical protein [Gemmatales bacterium]
MTRLHFFQRWLKTIGVALLGVAVAGLVMVESASAQNPPVYPSPRLLTITPPGGKLGTSVEVTVAGTDLDDATELHFSHPGLKAARVPDPDPNKAGQFVPNKFSVTIAPDVPLGIYDVRVLGKYGISNPRAFVVGDLNESQEKEPNNDPSQATPMELNSVVHGVINPNVDVDYFRFSGKQGQRVVIVCEASSVDSKLDPLVQLLRADHPHPLAVNRRYRDRDAVLDAVLPADADYLVRVVQHTHLQGGAEFFYRLSVSLAPWIDAAWPPVVEPGKPTSITLFGRNLPNAQPDPTALLDGRPLDRLVVEVPPGDPARPRGLLYSGPIPPAQAVLDGIEYRVRNAVGASNPVLLAFAQAPVILDNGDNDTPDKAQTITLPCELCGRVEKLRDRDFYRFTAKAGEVYVFEAFASRLGAPVDLFFELRRVDDKNPQSVSLVGEFDDPPANESPHPLKFNMRSFDPVTRFAVPADGTYELLIASREADLQAGPRHLYRLCIRKEQPDFRLVVVDHNDHDPSSTIVRQGASQFLHVLCLRQDDFNGEVTLSVEGLPAGVTCPPQTVGPNQKLAALVLTAADDAPPWAGTIRVVGKAKLGDQEVTREARAGCVLWSVPQQQGIPTISRVARSLWLAVREKGPFGLDCEPKELAVPLGGQAAFKVKIRRHQQDVKVPVQLFAASAPQAPNAQFQAQPQPLATLPQDKDEVEVKVPVPNNAVPGTYNLVLRAAAQMQFSKDAKAQKQNVSVFEAVPPIKLTVYNKVAELSLAEPSVQVKSGGEKELVVKINRLHGYKGEFKLSLVRPQNMQTVSAAEVTVPAEATEAKLVLKAAGNAPEASSGEFKVRAVATLNNVNFTHEANLTVAVVK